MLAAHPVAAQRAPIPQGDTAAAGPGARIRITLSRDSVDFGRYRWRPGFNREIEGTLVTMRPAGVDVRTVAGDTITFPASSIARLERYGGEGPCRATAAREGFCIVGGLIGGAALAAWGGDKVARQLDEPYPDRQKWRLRGAFVGALVMVTVVLPVMGRDSWVEITPLIR